MSDATHFDLTALDDRRKRHVQQALDLCSFDYGKVGEIIKVESFDIPTPGRMGYAMSDPPVITLDSNLGPKQFRRMLLEESGHIIDRRCLTDENRAALLAATGATDWWKSDPDPATGANRAYAYQGSENFAHQGFMLAFSPDLFSSNGWPHPYTRKAVRVVREVLA